MEYRIKNSQNLMLGEKADLTLSKSSAKYQSPTPAQTA